MTSRRPLAVLFFVGALVGLSFLFVRGVQADSAIGSPLKPMLDVLDRSGFSASFAFSARCEAPMPPEFPQFSSPTSTGGPPLKILSEILARNRAIRLSQDAGSRMIRIREQGIPDDILNVRISHISFNGVYSTGSFGVDNPNEALHIIMDSSEVVSFSRAHNIRIIFADYGIGGGGIWLHEHSHLSGSFDNLTVQQALDRVLKTFPGIWVYQNCPPAEHRSRKVYFRFFYLRDIGAGKFVEGSFIFRGLQIPILEKK